MHTRLKRALAAATGLALAAGVAPFLNVSPAFADGTLSGAATIKTSGGAANLQSGDGSTTFTLRPTAGAVCPGDGTAGYRVQTYMVPNSVDTTKLEFDSGGPLVPPTYAGQSVGSTFIQPLYTTTGSPILNQAPNAGDGAILPLPDANFEVFSPGDIPAGVYKLGIACTLGSASATQLKNFYEVKMTVSSPGGGNANIHWENGTAPDPSTITSVTPGTTTATSGQASVAFTNPAANPALTDCVIEVGTTPGGSEFNSGVSGSCTSPRTVTGLAYGTQYYFRLHTVNSVGISADSNELSGTPVRAAVANLSATPSPNTVTLNWDDATLLGTDSYNVDYCTLPATSPCLPASAGHVATDTRSTSDDTVGSLVAGQLYTFTVTYGAAGTSLASSVQSTPLSNAILLQDITVGRPNGTLVLTQVCGKWDAMPAETAQYGFPGGLDASAASATGSQPTGENATSYGQYPYPQNPDGTPNATYPTHCGIALGNAKLVAGPGAAGTNGVGQFFAAEGRLNQVTVVDTRDTDPGWTVNFAMSDLTNQSDATTISGNELGWTAQKTDTPAFQDGYGQTYDQVVNYVTQTEVPNTQGSAGAGTAQAVIQAPDATPGLGIATLDARIKLLIPIHAHNGNYAGTLTINAL